MWVLGGKVVLKVKGICPVLGLLGVRAWGQESSWKLEFRDLGPLNFLASRSSSMQKVNCFEMYQGFWFYLDTVRPAD